jgi:putative transposase
VKCAAVAALRQAQQGQPPAWSVRQLCHVLELAESTFYAWRARAQQPSRRAAADAALLAAIRVVHAASDARYGSPRVHDALQRAGQRVGRTRVARLMREAHLRGCQRGRPKGGAPVWNAQRRGHGWPVAPDRLGRRFAPSEHPRLNAVWVGDVTVLPTASGTRYLAVLLDLTSRRVVGWAVGPRLTSALTSCALQRALEARRPAVGWLHHSDQGPEYTAPAYRRRLAASGAVVSHSRVGNCWDNAVTESFFGTLKAELWQNGPLPPASLVETQLFHFIEIWYNRQRSHSTLGYRSPAAYERQLPPPT